MDELRVDDDLLDLGADHLMRFQGELFTGVAFEDHPRGWYSEVSYRAGTQHGPARTWQGRSGPLLGEDLWQDGMLVSRVPAVSEDAGDGRA